MRLMHGTFAAKPTLSFILAAGSIPSVHRPNPISRGCRASGIQPRRYALQSRMRDLVPAASIRERELRADQKEEIVFAKPFTGSHKRSCK
jgi:hypothetical protein